MKRDWVDYATWGLAAFLVIHVFWGIHTVNTGLSVALERLHLNP